MSRAAATTRVGEMYTKAHLGEMSNREVKERFGHLVTRGGKYTKHFYFLKLILKNNVEDFFKCLLFLSNS